MFPVAAAIMFVANTVVASPCGYGPQDVPPLVPRNAWDTHLHIFNPELFPYWSERTYTPAPSSVETYPFNETFVQNLVVVHATVQGPDPAALVHTLTTEQRPGLNLRGLAVLNTTNVTDSELDQLEAVGVRGIRLHVDNWGFDVDPTDEQFAQAVKDAAERLGPRDWIIDINQTPAGWEALAPTIRALPTTQKVVADHFAAMGPTFVNSSAFAAVLDLVRDKRMYVKLSAPERLYDPYPEGMKVIEPVAKAFIEAGPTQILWGSDWPHTPLAKTLANETQEEALTIVRPGRDVDETLHLVYLREWMNNETLWHNFMVDTPYKLFW